MSTSAGGDGPAKPNADEVEALATAISEGIHARGYHLSPPLVDDVTRTILASDWLAALRQNAADDRAEQIARELERKARVARFSKGAVPDDFERADVTRGNFDQQAWAFEQAARVARESMSIVYEAAPQTTSDAPGLREAVAAVLAQHADCVANDSRSSEWADGSGVTGVDVWSCGIEVPFVDEFDEMGRIHLATALARHLAPAVECRVFGCDMPALPDGKCVRCGDGPGRGPDQCPCECGRRKSRNQLMCGPCWAMVSPATQVDVLSSWRSWRRQTGDVALLQAYKSAARTAVREVTGS